MNELPSHLSDRLESLSQPLPASGRGFGWLDTAAAEISVSLLPLCLFLGLFGYLLALMRGLWVAVARCWSLSCPGKGGLTLWTSRHCLTGATLKANHSRSDPTQRWVPSSQGASRACLWTVGGARESSERIEPATLLPREGAGIQRCSLGITGANE